MKIGKFDFSKRWQGRDLIEGCKKRGIVPENCITKKDLLDWEADRFDDGIWQTGPPAELSFHRYLMNGIRGWKGGDKYEGVFGYEGEGAQTGFVRGTVLFFCLFLFCCCEVGLGVVRLATCSGSVLLCLLT